MHYDPEAVPSQYHNVFRHQSTKKQNRNRLRILPQRGFVKHSQKQKNQIALADSGAICFGHSSSCSLFAFIDSANNSQGPQIQQRVRRLVFYL